MNASALRLTRYAQPFVVTALLLGGCNDKSKTTMDLLHAGDPGICTAADVEETVRNMIRPGGVTTDGYTISFADASLESFDKVVSRATCNAALTIDGPNGSVTERTMIDFAVSPAAQNPSTFIVSGAFGSFTQRLADAISDAAVARSEQDSERQSQEALAALVKPGWLIGRWVPSLEGTAACMTGPFDDFGRGGRIFSDTATGRWRLNGQQVTVVMPDKTGTVTITDATMNDFTMVTAGGEENSYRRCEADEIRVLEDEPQPEPGDAPSEAPATEAQPSAPTEPPSS